MDESLGGRIDRGYSHEDVSSNRSYRRNDGSVSFEEHRQEQMHAANAALYVNVNLLPFCLVRVGQTPNMAEFVTQ